MIERDLAIDPWCHYLLNESRLLLQTRNKISAYDLRESISEDYLAPIKMGTLRKKLNELVALNLLTYIQGRGRTPSYYQLPKEQLVTPDYKQILKRYMRHIKSCDGTFFLDDAGYTPAMTPLTTAEFQELEELTIEINSENSQAAAN